MAIKLCVEPRCPNVVTSRGRCDEHRKELERERSRARREEARARNRLYASKRWRMFRRAKLRGHPICEECDGQLASEVHHVTALEDGGEPYSDENTRALCKPCHSRETRRELLQRQQEGVA